MICLSVGGQEGCGVPRYGGHGGHGYIILPHELAMAGPLMGVSRSHI